MSPTELSSNGAPLSPISVAAVDVEEDRISTSRVCKLPASERVALGLELVEGQPGLRDGYYVNVRNADAFLVTIIYSRASIMFIALIGAVSCFNTLLFNDKLSDSTNLCQLQKLFPTEERRNVMPVIYYCRFLHISVFTNVLQLFLCLFALVCALNRRSNLFLLCYALLCIVLLLAALCVGTLFAVDFDFTLRQSVQFSLRDVFDGSEPRQICRQMPILHCLRQLQYKEVDDDDGVGDTLHNNHSNTLMVSPVVNSSSLSPHSLASFCETVAFGRDKQQSPLLACSAELSSALVGRVFLFALILEYLLLLSIGFALSAKLVANRRRRIRGLKEGKLGCPLGGDEQRERTEEEQEGDEQTTLSVSAAGDWDKNCIVGGEKLLQQKQQDTGAGVVVAH